MAIKLGFSSLACPDWNLEKIIEQTAALGYNGVELRALGGQAHPHQAAELAEDPSSVKARFCGAGVQLLSVFSPAGFETPSRREAEENRCQLEATIELAGRLGCPFVRLNLGKMVGGEHRGTMSRVITHLRDLAPLAARHRTTLLVGNHGDFLGSEDVWVVVDGVDHPALRASWNPLAGRLTGERPTRSVPRLGRMIETFYIADAALDDDGHFLRHVLPGEGDIGLDRAVELLKGVCYQGWLVFEWPQKHAELAPPEEALPKALAFMRSALTAEQPILAAYKKDKNPAPFKAPPSVDPPAQSEAESKQ